MGSQEIVPLVVVISISVFIMAVLLIIIIYNVYRQRVKSQKILLDAVYNAQENERTRIAEDLHDDIGARLSALKLRIDAIREDSKDPGSVQLAEESITVLDGVVGDLRNIIRNQASKYLINNGFVYELDRFQKQLSVRNKTELSISVSPNPTGLDTPFGVNVFRIIQELVNNSIKHASCLHINISLNQIPGELTLNYNDDGIGFEISNESNKGMGLANIDARVRLYAGQYTLITSPGKGTSYTIVFKNQSIKPTD
ncbi:MAG: hypothetical protein IPI23_01495 [Bacteroidetes bacterium]|nr:hypothetical protein [Bacteroidota bacterium]MBK7387769.1 hypothetical protein [Bacteroidota bacterium]MBK7971165.1 hypothetical protein [Bacteroidota bacterium]MBK8415517.1 hypothetical protein [Bacteroidota bacterium]MBK9422575.1 hypothetical protein [Bacteroidota bacterium]